jgi:hypothetical protein
MSTNDMVKNNVQINEKYRNNILIHLNLLNECSFESIINELSKFEMFFISDLSSKPAYMTDNLLILKTHGNGLCWINALLVSIFGKWWQNIEEIDLWIRGLLSTFELDLNFIPMFNLYLYGIDMTINLDGIDNFDIITFLHP